MSSPQLAQIATDFLQTSPTGSVHVCVSAPPSQRKNLLTLPSHEASSDENHVESLGLWGKVHPTSLNLNGPRRGH